MSPSPSPTAPGHAITGTLTLHNGGPVDAYGSSACSGTRGYDDIKVGTAVAVTNEAGAVIGLDRLLYGSNPDTATCTYTFAVGGLPDAKFYGVEVSHRGVLRYSADELAKAGWTVDLSLGQ